MTPVERRLREAVTRHGPVPFSDFVEMALYDAEGGFYVTGGRAGREGDFLTSPEVGPLFGAVVARALDTWWHDMGEPDVFVVVEAGAGPGTLSRAVLNAGPRCAPSLSYVLVERSPSQRALHAARLPLADPTGPFASVLATSGAAPPAGERPLGPVVVSLPDLPRVAGPCVVLANELLDNLPFGVAERGPSGWAEVMVGHDGHRLTEVLVPLEGPEAATLTRLAPHAAPGARVPLTRGAAAWLRQAQVLAGGSGRVVVIDYARSTAQLADRPWKEWVRTYRRHGAGGHPLSDPGSQDITCEVAVDQLGAPPDADRSQADWLRLHGLEEMVEEGRRVWAERAAIGDLEAVRARSRVREAEALTDPTGLGAFRVLEWIG